MTFNHSKFTYDFVPANWSLREAVGAAAATATATARASAGTVAAEVPKIAGVGMLQQRQWRRHRKERRMRQQECAQLQE